MSTDDQIKDDRDAAARTAVQWRDGVVPYSSRFRDTYFSDLDGRAETVEVFLAGNGLPQRWHNCDAFTIVELGFGTGLNFLETVRQWRRVAPADARLSFVSFEQFPMSVAEMMKALKPWPDLHDLAQELLADWPGDGLNFSLVRGGVSLDVHLGDARNLIGQTRMLADAWYLDGFSPAQNPELWDQRLLASVFAQTVPGGTFSTYTAAGWVRRNLQDAGYDVRRVPGFGRKRERLQGRKPP